MGQGEDDAKNLRGLVRMSDGRLSQGLVNEEWLQPRIRCWELGFGMPLFGLAFEEQGGGTTLSDLGVTKA